jgi:hypothetical protein
VSWDHDASIQILVLRGSLDEFYALQRRAAQRRGALIETSTSELDERRVATIVSERPGRREELRFEDWGDSWVLVMIADAPIEDYALYRPWFQLVYLSIDHAAAGSPR